MKKTQKKEKILKVIIATLAVILVTLVSFVGIYVNKNGSYKNLIKNYDLGMELEGNRTVILKPDTSTNTVVKDKDGKEIENATDEDIQKNGYTKEEVPVNSQEILTEENYKESKKIIENRLKEYKFEEYSIKQDIDSGNIILELAENKNTDKVLSVINQQGKFEIKDSETKEVLMDNSMIKSAKVLYNNTASGTGVYLNIEFNKEGKEKLTQITTDYKTIEKESTEKTTSENAENSESAESEETTETSEENAEEKQKEIVMEIDGQTIITTSFEEPITTGELQLTVGSSSTDKDKLNDYIEQAMSTSSVLSNGKTPVKYTQDTNKYIKADISQELIRNVIIAIVVIIAVISIALVLKFKVKGFISAILAIGYIALILLLVRYTNVKVSSAGLIALICITVLNYILEILILNNSIKKEENKENIWKIISRYIFIIIPIFIISIIFTFATGSILNSFGMILFWGIILTLIYNIILAKPLLNK